MEEVVPCGLADASFISRAKLNTPVVETLAVVANGEHGAVNIVSRTGVEEIDERLVEVVVLIADCCNSSMKEVIVLELEEVGGILRMLIGEGELLTLFVQLSDIEVLRL